MTSYTFEQEKIPNKTNFKDVIHLNLNINRVIPKNTNSINFNRIILMIQLISKKNVIKGIWSFNIPI